MVNHDLFARRRASLGPAYSHFYDEPIHLVRGEGVWLWDASGNKYLDCYNNVPSVGHCHPDVVDAICTQAGTLNTHTRYLHENVVVLAERLAATLPGDLSVCMFVCTGTEANDLAVQIARKVTGHQGVIVTEAAYHGNSTLVRALSTDSYPVADRPDWLGVIDAPNYYRGRFRETDPLATARYVDCVDHSIAMLDQDGHQVAALMLDTIWDAPGPLAPPVDYVRSICAKVRAAGGMIIADEVQAGHARTGPMWGIEHFDLIPDIVTMGKPAGGGHPLAVVATTPEIACEFAQNTSYFNTFGGNPVSAAAGLAVLDVIESEQLGANARDTGAYLSAGLESLATRHKIMGAIQGRGLFLGVDLVRDQDTREPISKEEMRHLSTLLLETGILIGATGQYGNVLKIRPPLPFDRGHADIALAAIDQVFSTLSD